ncbi:aconitate hydratase AcnA [Deferribacter autotrophicus]|uniref:Aconitate hydratase n=1 Tax=Deferribacter autotrophicus TaxID=500465 RepID=A0A5A8F364_9BACT|nr:aconitate hydratase AcnA [Deferribacter autotrophicus]KAA0257956.1 aconitate hydratase AcnA [Deferribacter autotrophicus]
MFNKKEFIKEETFLNQKVLFVNLKKLNSDAKIEKLPFTIRILLENLLRNFDGNIVNNDHIEYLLNYDPLCKEKIEIPYFPSRILMQDFTGVPFVVDLAAMRDAAKELGKNPETINPVVPVDLIIDHSVQIDYFGTKDSLNLNVKKEYERNSERYQVLKWAQVSFNNFSVIPPNNGICHQVNLEYLSKPIRLSKTNGELFAFPDTVIGTDSHTPMVNGIGVLSWGVGGIEAEAVMLGQPYYMSIPQVIGINLIGKVNPGVTATDLVLNITEFLRKYGVVEKFVEFFGEGMKELSVPDRATISNMSPENGSTVTYFPMDEKTAEYLVLTNRENEAKIMINYTKQNLLFAENWDNVIYSNVLEFDLSNVNPSIAGPSRPHDKIFLSDVKNKFMNILNGKKKKVEITLRGEKLTIEDGSIVIAAITSCTNTSNPKVMLGAVLLAKKAVEYGLQVKPFVKASLAPGSKVVTDYLKKSGLLPYLEALKFHITAYGCTTCIGNSGPLIKEVEDAIDTGGLTVASVLSGNRNFEARIHNKVRTNFLASPILVVAYAIAGRIDINFEDEPLGYDPNGRPVFLQDIWPSNEEIDNLISQVITSNDYKKEYKKVFEGDINWQNLRVKFSSTFQWNENSTYIKKPPYFDNFTLAVDEPSDIKNARILLLLGDSVTTDHISPAGAIRKDYPAGKYLKENGVTVDKFNTYGSRRGNHEVMIRGTFGNVRIKNKLVAPKEGSFTIKFPENKEMFIYDAAMKYMEENIPLVVFAGKEYGTGSSRDWAAKGTVLLGIKAIIAESFERIHRSNLIGMGVLPIQFLPGDNYEKLGIKGDETISIIGINNLYPQKKVKIVAEKPDKNRIEFECVVRLDTEIEVKYFKHGGILPYVLRKFIN